LTATWKPGTAANSHYTAPRPIARLMPSPWEGAETDKPPLLPDYCNRLGTAMQTNHELLTQLRTHLGRRCLHAGRHWRLVEVLAADGRLVLESQEAEPPIQPDQYGNAAFRGPEHVELALFTDQGETTADVARLLQALNRTDG
jgi:hypothetical protein